MHSSQPIKTLEYFFNKKISNIYPLLDKGWVGENQGRYASIVDQGQRRLLYKGMKDSLIMERNILLPSKNAESESL